MSVTPSDCDEGMFQCMKGQVKGQCLPRSRLCDGTNDCVKFGGDSEELSPSCGMILCIFVCHPILMIYTRHYTILQMERGTLAAISLMTLSVVTWQNPHGIWIPGPERKSAFLIF